MNLTAMLELSDGTVAIVDSEDLTRVSAYEWRLSPNSAVRFPVGSYCRPERSCESVYLHRLIANAGPEDIVYHRNHNTLDNRRENLVVMGRLTAPAAVHRDMGEALTAD